MSEAQVGVNKIAAELIARCQAGFNNEFQWLAWLRKHADEINALPKYLRNRVVDAHNNATHKDFSR